MDAHSDGELYKMKPRGCEPGGLTQVVLVGLGFFHSDYLIVAFWRFKYEVVK